MTFLLNYKKKINFFILILGFVVFFNYFCILNLQEHSFISSEKFNYSKDLPIISGEHEPILIDNNWTAAKTAGICYGFGTYSEPYIIENFTINGLDTSTCIEIKNSNAYFIIRNCTVYNSRNHWEYAGIKLDHTNNGKLYNNTCLNCGDTGIRLETGCNNTIFNNNFNSCGESGISARLNSDKNNIFQNKFNNSHNAIFFYSSSFNMVKENFINNSWIGVYLSGANKNYVINNTAINNEHSGIIIHSDHNIISGNILVNNSENGIFSQHSVNNSILENIIYNNSNYGIYLMFFDDGIVTENNISKNRIGIYFNDHNDNNNFTRNIFQENNEYGVHIDDCFTDSSNNLFYQNSFINNGINAENDGTAINNKWDNNTIGNFWDDYEIKYPFAGNNGFIWDTPYEIDGSITDQDNYPLVYPFLFQKPIIYFEISDLYLNTTVPLETDLGFEINCSISNSSNLIWVYLCENSTGNFINRSMNLGSNGEWSYIVNISELQRGDKLMFSFYANDSYNKIGKNNNYNVNFTILIGDFYPPIINFDISEDYLNTTIPFETDLGLEINCTVSEYTNITWVYLYENSTGDFINRSMNLGSNGEWTYVVNISKLQRGYILTFLFYANDSYNNIGKNNNYDHNYTILIGGFFAPIIYFNISEEYLNTTSPLDTDLGFEINCSISNSSILIWVYLCENSTGNFINRSMNLGSNGEWSYIVDISQLYHGDELMFSFYAYDSNYNIAYFDNFGSNFIVEIYSKFLPSIEWQVFLGFPGDDMGLIASPAVVDVDNDMQLEVVIGSSDSLHCFNGKTGIEKWVFDSVSPLAKSSPVIADLDGDGQLEIVIGSGGNQVTCVDAATGTQEWIYTGAGSGCQTTPAVGDIDGDGQIEVVFGCNDDGIYCINGANGEEEWIYYTYGPVTSSPVLGDIDNDGQIEVVAGSNDDFVYCLNGTGDLEWKFETMGDIWFNPIVLGDINADNLTEVVFGSQDGKVYCLNGSTGALIWYYPAYRFISTGPVLGDVDSDGLIDVVIGGQDSTVYCLNGATGTQKWATNVGGSAFRCKPALVDVGNDSQIEILIGNDNGYHYCLNGSTGEIEWSLFIGNRSRSSPTIVDIDNDGRVEIYFGADNGNLYCLSIFGAVVPTDFVIPNNTNDSDDPDGPNDPDDSDDLDDSDNSWINALSTISLIAILLTCMSGFISIIIKKIKERKAISTEPKF